MTINGKGRVPEWLNGLAWRASVSWKAGPRVRIPPLPHMNLNHTNKVKYDLNSYV